MRSLDETLIGTIQMRANAWATRAVAGSATVVLNTVVADQRSLTPQEIQQLGNFDATAVFAWKVTGDLIAHESVAPSLKAAYAAADNAYFKGDFAVRRARFIDDLSNGRTPAFTVDTWRSAVTENIDAVAKVASEAIALLYASAQAKKAEAFTNAVIYLAVFVATFLVCIGGLIVISRRITRPICRLSQTMMGLASGDLSIDVPGAGRGGNSPRGRAA
jgi:methyl-accepting chemotaxis protein